MNARNVLQQDRCNFVKHSTQTFDNKTTEQQIKKLGVTQQYCDKQEIILTAKRSLAPSDPVELDTTVDLASFNPAVTAAPVELDTTADLAPDAQQFVYPPNEVNEIVLPVVRQPKKKLLTTSPVNSRESESSQDDLGLFGAIGQMFGYGGNADIETPPNARAARGASP